MIQSYTSSNISSGKIKFKLSIPILAATDIALIISSFSLASLLTKKPISSSLYGQNWTFLLLVTSIWLIMFIREGLYPGHGYEQAQIFRKQAIASLLAGSILLLLSPLLDDKLPLAPQLIIISTFLNIPFLHLGRQVIQNILTRFNLWGESVIILGASQSRQNISKTLYRMQKNGFRPIAIFDDNLQLTNKYFHGIPILGSLDESKAFAKKLNIKRGIVTLENPSPSTLQMLTDGNDGFRHLQVLTSIPSISVHSITTGSINHLLTLEMHNNLSRRHNQILKRSIDIAGALGGGLLISPVLIIIAICIKLGSPGPIIYHQERIGKNGKRFKILKFRSMVTNSDEALNNYLSKNPEARSEWENSHKLKKDPRITRIGKFLRKYSLDELPQLWNVIIGEMSLVGPRPIVDAETSKYGNNFKLYTTVKPGMTGFWQTRGRSNTSYTNRVELDSFYVQNWSIWLDIIIFFDTFSVVTSGSGSY